MLFRSQTNKELGASELIWRLTLNGIKTDAIKVPAKTLFKPGWNHVAVTHTSGTQRMYINGKQVGSNTSVGLMPAAPAGLTIGATGATSGTDPSRTYYLEGNIGIVRVYNRVLTNIEIASNFNRDRGRFGL